MRDDGRRKTARRACVAPKAELYSLTPSPAAGGSGEASASSGTTPLAYKATDGNPAGRGQPRAIQQDRCPLSAIQC